MSTISTEKYKYLLGQSIINPKEDSILKQRIETHKFKDRSRVKLVPCPLLSIINPSTIPSLVLVFSQNGAAKLSRTNAETSRNRVSRVSSE